MEAPQEYHADFTQHTPTEGKLNTQTNTIKTRLVKAIGLSVVERPRDLQLTAATNEHHIVHALYRLQKDGLVAYRTKKSIHSPGKNLTAIHLTKQGVEVWRKIRR